MHLNFIYLYLLIFFHNALANSYPIDVETKSLWIDVKTTIRKRIAEGDSHFHLKRDGLCFDISSNGYEHYLDVAIPNKTEKGKYNYPNNKTVYIKKINKKIKYITLSTTSKNYNPGIVIDTDGCVFCLKYNNSESSKAIFEKIINYSKKIKPIPVLGVIILDEVDNNDSEEIKADPSLFK